MAIFFILFWLLTFMGNCAQAATAAHFLAAQVHDPLNPIISYNLGIAALEQKNYTAAERHFSLAVDLHDRQSKAIVPSYFCWADTAALQLLGMLEGQKELKDEALSNAIKRAVDASNRYGNVLVFDAEHAQARERKKIVDRLRALLEQQKKQQEEQKEQEKQNKQEKKDPDSKEDQQQQDGSQSEDQKQSGEKQQQEKPGDQTRNDDQKPESGPEQDGGGGEKKQSKKSQEQSQTGREEEKQEETQSEGQESASEAEPEKMSGQEKEGENKAASAGEGPQEDKQEKAAAGDENVSTQALQEDATESAGTAMAEYDANAEMVKKRAMVLLDRLQQNEAALQKQQLLKKSAAQMGENARYNQW